VSVETGKWSEIDVIPGAKYATPDWTPDGKAFYYEYLPHTPSVSVAERPGYTEVRLHRLGTDPLKDALVHPRTGDATSFLSSGLSRDGKLLFISVAHGWSENDVFLKRLGRDTEFKPLARGNGRGARYQLVSTKDHLFILTDEGAARGRVMKASVERPERKDWTELIPEEPGAVLEDLSLVGGQLVLRYLKNAASELRAFSLEGKPIRTLELPQPGTTTDVAGLEDDDEAFFGFSSFLEPKQVQRISLRTGARSVWAKVDVPIDPSPYTVEQVWYPSRDGTRISMFLVHRKDLVKDGSAPTLMNGYGGFGNAMTPAFFAWIYPWLEAGGIFAVPNLRGGAEYGTAWHEAGKLHQKQNVFDDFLAAAQYLSAERYTRPERLAITGGSNGGLLVGAAMVQRPELFGAVLCSVPLLDMVRYHLFGSGRTWIPEYGSAEKAEDFKVLRAYSPYHAVRPGVRYPALLVLSADHDDRVDPMHARKFIAAIQTANPGGAPAYLRVETNAGHTGADQVRKSVETRADSLAFLFQAFGMAAGTGEKPAQGQAPTGE
jgi:prolyl oligopeptidase